MSAQLISDLRTLTAEFGALLKEESSAIRAANFARAISLHDRKFALHARMTTMLEAIRTMTKTPEQTEEIREVLQSIKDVAKGNQSALEIGFTSIERLVSRIVTVVRRALHKDTPRYTAHGAYHSNRSKSLVLQTDQRA